MCRVYDYSPRRCNLASCLSWCIERDVSKVIITLPTNNKIVFEKALIESFRCVNTRLGFDIEISMLIYYQAEYNNKTTCQSFKSSKKKDLKRSYKLKLDDDQKPIPIEESYRQFSNLMGIINIAVRGLDHSLEVI